MISLKYHHKVMIISPQYHHANSIMIVSWQYQYQYQCLYPYQYPYRYQRKYASKKPYRQLFTINYSSFIIHWGGHRPSLFWLPLRSLRGRCHLGDGWGVIKSFAVRQTHFFRGGFSEAHLHCADTFFAVARPGIADQTMTRGTDESVPYERPLAAAES